MLLMSETKSLTSQVSYLKGMNFGEAIGGRARLGEDPWLEEEVADEEFANVVEEAVVGWEIMAGTLGR